MMTPANQPTEVEAKFTVAGPALLHELAKPKTAVPGYRFGEVRTREVRDLYLDTPDYRLLRRGFQLRVRTGEDQWLATLKSRGIASEEGIYHRLEIEEPLAAARLPASIDELPAAIDAAIAEIVDKHTTLTPICSIDQTRRVREVTAQTPGRKRQESAVIGLLSLDEMRIRQHAEGSTVARAWEIEIELTAGTGLAELQVLADRFIGVYGLTPSADSKLERALSIISRHPADAPESWEGLHIKMQMGEACRMIWHEQFMRMLLNEAGVRYANDPEYVHDARVAIRRARAAARIYRDYFKPKAVRKYLKRLRRTAELLGAVRDLDVAIGKLQNYQQKTKKQSAGDLQATLDQWLARRGAAQRALVEWLDSREYADFVADFLHFCRTPGAGIVDLQPEAGAPVVPFQVRHVVPTLLLSNFDQVRAYEVWFEGADEVPVETLHRLRIACKYLRYNLEFMAGLLGPECAAIIALLRRLQDDLGDLNDAVVSSHLLTTDANAAPPVARYARSQEELIDKLRRQMRGDFARFVAAENRERLLAALAKL